MSLCFGSFPQLALRFHNILQKKTTTQFHDDKYIRYNFETIDDFEKYCDLFFKKISKSQRSLVIVETAQLPARYYTNLRQQLNKYTEKSALISPFDACLSAAFYHIVQKKIFLKDGDLVLICLVAKDARIWVLCSVEGYVIHPIKKGTITTPSTQATLDELRKSFDVDLTFVYGMTPVNFRTDASAKVYGHNERYSRDALLTGAQAKALFLAKADPDLYDVAPCLPCFQVRYEDGTPASSFNDLQHVPFTLRFTNPTRQVLQICYADEVLTLESHKPGRALTNMGVADFVIEVKESGMFIHRKDPSSAEAPHVPDTKLIIKMTCDVAQFFTYDKEKDEATIFTTRYSSVFPLVVSYASGAPVCEPFAASQDFSGCREFMVGGFSGFLGRAKNDIEVYPFYEFKLYCYENEDLCVEYMSGRRPNQKKVCRTANAVFKDMLLALITHVDGFDPATEGIAMCFKEGDYTPGQVEVIKQIAQEANLIITDTAIQVFDIVPEMFSM